MSQNDFLLFSFLKVCSSDVAVISLVADMLN